MHGTKAEASTACMTSSLLLHSVTRMFAPLASLVTDTASRPRARAATSSGSSASHTPRSRWWRLNPGEKAFIMCWLAARQSSATLRATWEYYLVYWTYVSA